jgi:hypothetical protein
VGVPALSRLAAASLRRLRARRARLTAPEAIACARAFAERRGWPWRQETRAQRIRLYWVGPARWLVETHWDHRGGTVRVEIDDRTGEVLHAGYLPR